MDHVGFVKFGPFAFFQLRDHPDGFLPVIGMDACEIAFHRNHVTAVSVWLRRMIGMVSVVIAVENVPFHVAPPRDNFGQAQSRRERHILAGQLVFGMQ